MPTQAGALWQETLPGKRVALFDLTIDRAWAGERRSFRLAVRVIERTIDKKGQTLLMPEIDVEGWWTSLADAPEKAIAHYAWHGTHEQFHSEIETDLGHGAAAVGQVRHQRHGAGVMGVPTAIFL